MPHSLNDANRAIDRLIAELRKQGISDERVLAAIRHVPRDQFVGRRLTSRAWENHALPIEYGQSISQPYVVAAMTEALHLGGTEHVLEIGAGSGYQTAILSRLARDVVSIERIEPLAERARATLAALGYENVTIFVGDGSAGRPDLAPFDAIIVTAGAPDVPPSLVAQLESEGGRLVVPIGPERSQELVAIQRHGDHYDETNMGPVAFVPLIGSEGWPAGRMGPMD